MTNKEEAKEESTGEKRAQTVMIGIIMLLVGWSFKATIESGQDIAAIKVQLLNIPALQQKVNDHGLELNGLRIDEDNSKRAISDLQSRKR